jgi:hypothetical protein
MIPRVVKATPKTSGFSAIGGVWLAFFLVMHRVGGSAEREILGFEIDKINVIT